MSEVSRFHQFQIGNIISLNTKKIPDELFGDCPRNFKKVSFQHEDLYLNEHDQQIPQTYIINDILTGGSESIPLRKHYVTSYIPEGNTITMLKLTMDNHYCSNTLSDDEDIYFFINLTDMSLCQYVDAMPTHIINKINLFENPSLHTRNLPPIE